MNPESTSLPMLRVGHGFDVHSFGSEPHKNMMLAGVKFDMPALVGHSDGDVVIHAIIDSVLSPIGLGDIGKHFSDQDPASAGADSMGYLKEVAAKIEASGWSIINIDVTIIADAPKISPNTQQMQSNIEQALGGVVSIKGKTTEGVVHHINAISCHAVALLAKVDNG